MRAEGKWSLKTQQMKPKVIPPNSRNLKVATYLSSKLAKKKGCKKFSKLRNRKPFVSWLVRPKIADLKEKMFQFY